MTLKDKLLKQLPKKYHDRVADFALEDDLCDNCKYIIAFTDNYTDGDCKGGCYAVASIKEAIAYIKTLQQVN